MLNRAIKLKPLAIAQHGASTNRFWDMGQMDKSLDYLKRIRDLGVMVGLSCHNPLEVEYAEDKGWDLDYFMTSLYSINRSRQEFEKILGQVPLGEIYLPADPPRMMQTIRKTKRPCLTYKVLAAGRTVNPPNQVRERMAVPLNGKSEGWPAPGPDAIVYLAGKGIRCVATDGPTLGGAEPKRALMTYWALGSKGMAGVEFLTNAAKVPADAYFIFAPVYIRDCHGGPGRAIALF